MKEDKIKVTRPVYLFLVKNKAYKQFITNSKKRRKEGNWEDRWNDREAVSSTKFPSEAILRAFVWIDTPEGSEFWSKLYIKSSKIWQL